MTMASHRRYPVGAECPRIPDLHTDDPVYGNVWDFLANHDADCPEDLEGMPRAGFGPDGQIYVLADDALYVWDAAALANQ